MSASRQPTSIADIRHWARTLGFRVGKRGRLPLEIIEAYDQALHNTTSTPTAEPQSAAEASAGGPGATGSAGPSSAAERASTSLDPLGDYLDPQFGNVYEYDGFERPLWNDDLQAAVKRFLVEELSGDLFATSCNYLDHRVPAGSREEQAEFVIEHEPACQIADAVHMAAVQMVPTLDTLLGDITEWHGHTELASDAEGWFAVNATAEQLAELERLTGKAHLDWELATYAFKGTLSPRELLAAWRKVSEPAPSDLTDKEWQLLAPLLLHPSIPEYFEARTRAAINGMRYKFASAVPWSHIPTRYGRPATVYMRYRNYRQDVFPGALAALRGSPGAARLVEWLEAADSS